MATPQMFLPGEPHGQRSLVGYSPQGCKELDTTEATQHAYTYNNTDIKINPNHNTKSCCMWYTKFFYPIHSVSVWGHRRKINICSLLKFIKSKEYPQGS